MFLQKYSEETDPKPEDSPEDSPKDSPKLTPKMKVLISAIRCAMDELERQMEIGSTRIVLKPLQELLQTVTKMFRDNEFEGKKHNESSEGRRRKLAMSSKN